LLDIISPPDPHDDGDGDDSVDDLPSLGPDASDDSDKADSMLPFDEEVEHERPGSYTMVAADGAEGALDDATPHLLFTASPQHLPPPGIEQVFEADTGNEVAFTRERSKLTREERIKLVKTIRESSGSGSLGVGHGAGLDSTQSPEKPYVAEGEKWGPGGEVVQELKDVIWKVGERRRRMGTSSLPSDAVKAWR